MKHGIIFVFLITLTLTTGVLSVIFFSKISLADTGTVEIAVNVSTVSALSVQPTYLEWIQVAPGSNGTDQTITITNTGSQPFSTGIYASVDSFAEETSNPLGSSDPASYAAGGFLVLTNHTDTNIYYFVNRLEWNDTSIASSVTGKSAAGVSWGFFRNKTQRFLWEIAKDNNNECLNTTSGAPNTMAFKIKTTAFDGTDYDIGTGTVSATGYANTTEWSSWNFTSGPLASYCIAIAKNCQKFMLYRYDKNSSLPACATTKYLNSTLAPSGQLLITANVWLPEGIPAGNATQSTLTITAT
ncbi:MAG: hypothetical protein QMD36_03965 [Candidatus Aenigmarchaeota archaeon]|nr:hypothetical protein [Candidatus Aenigmarchaeota archaeon]